MCWSQSRSLRVWWKRKQRLDVGATRTDSSSSVFRDDSIMGALGHTGKSREDLCRDEGRTSRKNREEPGACPEEEAAVFWSVLEVCRSPPASASARRRDSSLLVHSLNSGLVGAIKRSSHVICSTARVDGSLPIGSDGMM